MSDSHWGERSLKGPLVTVVGAVAFFAALIGLYFWSPWERPTEADWLGAYEAWTEGIEARLAAGEPVSRASCETTFDDVGNPPAERLEPAARAARRGCTMLSQDGWSSAQSDVVRAIVDAHGLEAAPRLERDFSEIASAIAGTRADVYCWAPEHWGPFAQQYAVLRADEEAWMKGVADVRRHRIDLEPGVCGALVRYVRRIRPPALSYENFALAEALVVLAHQAEHLKAPSASEQEVECYAVQHVRPLLRSGGWGAFLQNEIALHGWDIAYTQLPPRYRTPDCRNGGPLDRNPRSNAWP